MPERHVWTIPDQSTKKGEFILAQLGPLSQIELQVAEADRRALDAIGEPIPAPVKGRALIDTGASISAVRTEIAERLGLHMVGDVPLVGQSGVSNRAPVYYGEIRFSGADIPPWSSTLAGINIAGRRAT